MSGQHSTTTEIDCPFWQQWQLHQDYLYRCCLKQMGGNQTEAEDALSRAMLKAREKLRTIVEPVKNLRGWLVELTNNLCKDIRKNRNRGPVTVEDLEAIAPTEEWTSQQNAPVMAAIEGELELFFNGAIDNLPPRLRETFVLYFQKQQSYKEIAEQLNISNPNVRKRISQARAILRKQWNEYQGKEESACPQKKKQGQPKTAEVSLPVETQSSPTTLASSVESLEGPVVDSEISQEVVAAGEKQLAALPALPEVPTLAKIRSDGESGDRKNCPQTLELHLDSLNCLPLIYTNIYTHTQNKIMNERERRRLSTLIPSYKNEMHPILARTAKADRTRASVWEGDKSRDRSCFPQNKIALAGDCLESRSRNPVFWKNPRNPVFPKNRVSERAENTQADSLVLGRVPAFGNPDELFLLAWEMRERFEWHYRVLADSGGH